MYSTHTVDTALMSHVFHFLTQWKKNNFTEQRVHWQHMLKDKTAGYFWYETKIKLLNSVNFIMKFNFNGVISNSTKSTYIIM